MSGNGTRTSLRVPPQAVDEPGDERTPICPVHRRATIDGVCHDCLAEASDAVTLIVTGVAAANVWASTVLRRYCGPRRRAPRYFDVPVCCNCRLELRDGDAKVSAGTGWRCPDCEYRRARSAVKVPA